MLEMFVLLTLCSLRWIINVGEISWPREASSSRWPRRPSRSSTRWRRRRWRRPRPGRATPASTWAARRSAAAATSTGSRSGSAACSAASPPPPAPSPSSSWATSSSGCSSRSRTSSSSGASDVFKILIRITGKVIISLQSSSTKVYKCNARFVYPHIASCGRLVNKPNYFAFISLPVKGQYQGR